MKGSLLSALISFACLGMLAQPTNFPDAPDVELSYLDGTIFLNLSNENPLSNNYQEWFETMDLMLPDSNNIWKFEGFLVYQVQLGFSELDFNNPDVARLVAQSDIENESIDLFNAYYDAGIDGCALNQEVYGSNSGVLFDYEFTLDAWTNQPFIEGEVYCYIALAYATHPDGSSDDCPNLPYQFIRSMTMAQGGLSIFCKTASNPTHVEELGKPISFTVAPNPAENSCVIQAKQTMAGEIVVRSLTGQEYLRERISGERHVLDTEDLPTGIYLVQLLSQSGVYTQKLVKRN